MESAEPVESVPVDPPAEDVHVKDDTEAHEEDPQPEKKRRSNRKHSDGEAGSEDKPKRKVVNYKFTEARKAAFYSKCVPANKKAAEERRKSKQSTSFAS